ncbi:uncharacterized protein LOC128520112 [Clarias gariepinus]|uniref:uncharacterized protein LOC128520112 n=1 Tax=Clarias gariepinus TaxID=13013 RepID=UPI00234C0C0E|nr:uncharacterized protein LOC128520112 [Clarias gariepinus]
MATRFQEASLTITDLIQKSHLICEGPPAQYRLVTNRKNLERDGSVRKWTFGQRDRQTKIIMMVGETGTGKTTLINAMVNYMLGVKFTDEVWFEITEEEEDNPISDQSKSKTTNITVYEVHENQFSLTIIDTPGYGDTRGREYDRQIAENLNKLFHSENGVKEIDVVCLVASKYLSNGVLSLFGKDLENNIIIMVTHSDGITPEDALSAIKKAGIPSRKNQPEYFLFNNRQTVKRSPKYNTSLQTAWEQTECSLKNFFASLKEQNRKSLKQTKRVLTESRHLETCVSNLQNHIEVVKEKD